MTNNDEALQSSKKLPIVNILNSIAFCLNVFVMYGLRLFGVAINAEVPATFPTLITPASWARALWPVILVIQLIWVVIQLLPKYQSVELVDVVGRKYIYVSVAQIAWSLCFSYQILSLSFVAIIVMLVFLFIIFRAQSSIEVLIKDYIMFKFPFSILFGWIVVVTFCDFNVLLVGMGVSATVQFYVALVSLTGMLLVAGSVFDLTVLLVIAWAMIGIYAELRNPDYIVASTFDDAHISTVRAWTLVSFVIVLVLIAYRLFTMWRERSSDKKDTTSMGDSATDAAVAETSEGGGYINMA